MKIALGADHRGFGYKERIKNFLTGKGIKSEDFGCFSESSADYPDHGIKAAESVAKGLADYGIIICGSGNGMLMSANKVKGIRAGIAINAEMAGLARAHNDANVLVLADMYTPENELEEIVDAFLNTKFEGGRHARRVNKISDYEKG
jgi:ribose 5-phosphate isomerase B